MNHQSQTEKMESALVLGSGNFGTCLAHYLSQQKLKTYLWSRSAETAKYINEQHAHPKFLRPFTLSPNITAINTIDQNILNKISLIIFAIPVQALREVLDQLKKFSLPHVPLVIACKGIEQKTLLFPNEIFMEIYSPSVSSQIAVLSGPSFAEEIMSQQPTAVTVAGTDAKVCEYVQNIFHSPYFRVYSSSDPVGLEVAGALKNVIAIAAGACIGLGFQMNTRAALLTRGLAEIARVGLTKGATPLSFLGLGGVGDLFLTCTSEKSRNFSLGYLIGKGLNAQEALHKISSVAEGYYTSQSAYALVQKLKIDAPIIQGVYDVLYNNKSIKKALTDLINRDAKPEFESNLTGI